MASLFRAAWGEKRKESVIQEQNVNFGLYLDAVTAEKHWLLLLSLVS